MFVVVFAVDALNANQSARTHTLYKRRTVNK